MLVHGEALEALRALASDSVDALVTDPPAGIAFMRAEWDRDRGGRDVWVAWLRDVMVEARRVLKPGAHGLVWALPRVSHWTATALEDAGFEIRDVVTHLFGSGFPKSLDVSRAIDELHGATRTVLYSEKFRDIRNGDGRGIHGANLSAAQRSQPQYIDVERTTATTDDAKAWTGYGTALKPAAENWILIRKPLSEATVARNVLRWGVGALNIDATRIAGDAITTTRVKPPLAFMGENPRPFHEDAIDVQRFESHAAGRFPANVVLSHNPDCVELGARSVRVSTHYGGQRRVGRDDGYGYDDTPSSDRCDVVGPDGRETVATFACSRGCAVAELDAQSGESTTTPGVRQATQKSPGWGMNGGVPLEVSYDDRGGASRFFYVAKPSTAEKQNGCDELPPGENGGRGNHHPTVKPTALMRYFIRMVTPPGGTVLDPFAGSGTTLVAAAQIGHPAIGVEREAVYVAIAAARVAVAVPPAPVNAQLDLFAAS